MSVRLLLLIFIVITSLNSDNAYAVRCSDVFRSEISFGKKNSEIIDGVNIEITYSSLAYKSINKSTLYNGLRAASLVIRKFTSESQTIKIEIVDTLIDSNGNHRYGEFQPDSLKVVLALDTIITGTLFKDIPLEVSLTLMIGHETTHWGQHFRGEKFLGSDADPNYHKNPLEIEAWKTSAEVFKEIYPNATGSINMTGFKITLPNQVGGEASLTFNN